MRDAVYRQKLSLQGMAFAHDHNLRRKVVDAGSVQGVPLTPSTTSGW